MSKGGARTGAGRKSKWSNSKTVNIRVPEYLATEVMAYAQQLDRQRMAESQQRQLITLLQELVHIPLAKRNEWIEALPESSQSMLDDAQGKIEVLRTEVKSQQFQLADSEADGEQVSTANEEFEVGLEVLYNPDDPDSSAVATSTLEHQWVFHKKNGKFDVKLPVPLKEDFTLAIKDGIVFLELHSRWAVSCLVARRSFPNPDSSMQ
jgi:hypothetical protein